MTTGDGCVVWDEMCTEGIDALNELEADGYIESYEISPVSFATETGFSGFPVFKLPWAKPGHLPEGGYSEPHWLPIRYECSLKLIALRYADFESSKAADQQSEVVVDQQVAEPNADDLDFVENDPFENVERIQDERQRSLEWIV